MLQIERWSIEDQEQCSVDQLVFAAINVRILECQETGYSNCTKCSHATTVCLFDPTAKSRNINSAQTFVDLRYLDA